MMADAQQSGLVALAVAAAGAFGATVNWLWNFIRGVRQDRREAADGEQKRDEGWVRITQDGFVTLNRLQQEDLMAQRAENAQLKTAVRTLTADVDTLRAEVDELKLRTRAKDAQIDELLATVQAKDALIAKMVQGQSGPS